MEGLTARNLEVAVATFAVKVGERSTCLVSGC